MSVAEQCIGQLNIWDLMTAWGLGEIDSPQESQALPSLEEAVRMVEERYGIKFEKSQFYGDPDIVGPDKNPTVYVWKRKKFKIELDEGHYVDSVDNGARFIGLSIEDRTDGYRGGGYPCDDMEKIYKCIEREDKLFEYITHR